MTRRVRKRSLLLLMFGSRALVACQLHRPTTVPNRTLEPQLLEPQLAEQPGTVAKNPNAVSIRLFSTESRGNIGFSNGSLRHCTSLSKGLLVRI